jgi:hypothetical protein
MAPITVLKSLSWLVLFSKNFAVLANPSADSLSPLDSHALSLLHARSSPLEIRGVYNGRKRRYIVERQDDSRKCCKEKLCLTLMGQILDENCKCEKCVTGFPALDGKSCQEDCPDSK